jgi:hypothetical protein
MLKDAEAAANRKCSFRNCPKRQRVRAAESGLDQEVICLDWTGPTMAKQTISTFVSIAVLGLLVFVFSLTLLLIAAPLFVPRTPGIGGFAFGFSISRRSFTGALVAVGAVVAVAVAVFLINRARRTRRVD